MILAALRSLLNAVRRRIRDDERFFKLPYDIRVKTVQDSYSHAVKKKYFKDFFQQTHDEWRRGILANPRISLDYMLGYALALRAGRVMQLGAYLLLETQALIYGGYEGEVVATDYCRDHLGYLKTNFAGSPIGKVDYRILDAENPAAADFSGIDLVFCLAVLANIQPEGVHRLFRQIADSGVSCFVIGDMYRKETLGFRADPMTSLPLRGSMNWAHPYAAMAAHVGLDCVFYPDFNPDAFEEARGVFVVHRGLPESLHRDAAARAMASYAGRYSMIWPR